MTSESDPDIWKEMRRTYREMGLTEEETAKRIICKTTKIINGELCLNECDQKGGD